MTPQFWSGQRVFLTGHTGFKGAWLSLWLQQLGAKVHGYALPAEDGSALFEAAQVEQGMTQDIADIRDLGRLQDSVTRAAPTIVIHMAAQSLVRRSYASPLETYAVNVMGTAHLLEAVRQTGGVSATLIVTSDKCYENNDGGRPFVEGDAKGGNDPYSSSKGCAELVAAAYARSFPSELGPVAAVRAGNVIGGGDWSQDRILPDTFRALFAGKKVAIRNPHAIRPWQHVLEPLSGYLAAAEHLSRGMAGHAAWNFGPDPRSEATVEHVAVRCCALWGTPDATEIVPEAGAPHEAAILRLDSSRARRELAWRPRWTLEETLERSVDWYRASRRGADMRAVTLAQIAAYQGC